MSSSETRSVTLSRPRLVLAGAALLALGGAAGAGVAHFARPPAEAMAPASPVPIASLESVARPWIGEPVVAVRGRVVQVYGDNFVLNDGSGQALVEIGRHGDDGGTLAANQIVTVQGRYADGVIRASYLVGADGRIAALGHRGPPHHGRFGPDPRRDDQPAPPPPASGNAVAPAVTG